jgi:hypothetical protein
LVAGWLEQSVSEHDAYGQESIAQLPLLFSIGLMCRPIFIGGPDCWMWKIGTEHGLEAAMTPQAFTKSGVPDATQTEPVQPEGIRNDPG